MGSILRVVIALLLAGPAVADHQHEGIGREAATAAKKAHLKDVKKLLANPVCRQTEDDRQIWNDVVREHETFDAPDWSPCFDDVTFLAEHSARPCPSPLFGKIHSFKVQERLLQRTETGYHPDGTIKNVRCFIGEYIHRKTITCCGPKTPTDSDWLPGEVLDDGGPASRKPATRPRGSGKEPPPEPGESQEGGGRY